MKTQSFPRILALILLAPPLAMAEDIRLNFLETPDRTSAFTLEDLKNTGTVTGSKNQIVCIDEVGPVCIIAIGDAENPSVSGRVRKGFLLFRLPSMEGKKLAKATLHLFLAQIKNEADGKPLPPASLFHAGEWNDEAWTGDPRFKGLELSHFSEGGIFNEQVPLCTSENTPGKIITIDVTDMVRKDYGRSGEPVAVFRMEVAEHEKLDIADQKPNLYVFWGPNFTPPKPDRVPTLVLSFE